MSPSAAPRFSWILISPKRKAYRALFTCVGYVKPAGSIEEKYQGLKLSIALGALPKLAWQSDCSFVGQRRL